MVLLMLHAALYGVVGVAWCVVGAAWCVVGVSWCVVCCSKTLQRTLKKQGMDFKMSTKVTGAERLSSGGMAVTMESVKGGKQETMECDVLLVCVGRRPYTDDLGLQVGVAMGWWAWSV